MSKTIIHSLYSFIIGYVCVCVCFFIFYALQGNIHESTCVYKIPQLKWLLFVSTHDT